MHPSWTEKLAPEFEKPYFKELLSFVAKEREKHTVYPPPGEVFTALDETPFESVKVVLFGQDPYHGAGQGHGLSFSVKPGVVLPPSLRNIYKELKSDVGFNPPGHGCLSGWARQGVLLLNSVLTVREKEPASHADQGWETFTDAILKSLRKKPCVFVLWGRYAKEKSYLADPELHRIVTSAHPSPLSASNGFFGSRPFSKVNAHLQELGLGPINWQLDPA